MGCAAAAAHANPLPMQRKWLVGNKRGNWPSSAASSTIYTQPFFFDGSSFRLNLIQFITRLQDIKRAVLSQCVWLPSFMFALAFCCASLGKARLERVSDCWHYLRIRLPRPPE